MHPDALKIKPSPDALAILRLCPSVSQAQAYRLAMIDAVLLGIEKRRAEAEKEIQP